MLDGVRMVINTTTKAIQMAVMPEHIPFKWNHLNGKCSGYVDPPPKWL